MKSKIIGAVCIILFGFICCHKEFWENNENGNGFMSQGKITGPDLRMCPSPCCSGWYIVIDSVTYEFDSIPSSSNINLQKDPFPIFVKLNWHLLDIPACPNKRITIQKITRLYLPD